MRVIIEENETFVCVRFDNTVYRQMGLFFLFRLQARLRSGAGGVFVGAIVCKLDLHRMARRGYIAMLAVHSHYRRHKIGRTLVTHAISAMIAEGCDEVGLMY